MDNVRVGTVKFFNDKRGYGFVIDNETKKEYFFHYSAIDSAKDFKKVVKGWTVRYILGTREDGKDVCTWLCSAKDLIPSKDDSSK